jgi:hypothetical protein
VLSKLWEDLKFHGELDVKMLVDLTLFPMVDSLMLLKDALISETFSTEWDSLIKKLLLFQELTP